MPQRKLTAEVPLNMRVFPKSSPEEKVTSRKGVPLFEDHVLISLRKLLDEWDRNDVDALLGTFRCERDPDVESFLLNKAISFHDRHLSRTYLVVSSGYSSVLAYVTLGVKCLRIPENNRISRSIEKKMNVFDGICQNYLI